MQCPYCGGELKNKIRYFFLSRKRLEIVNFLLEAGPGGIELFKLKERFFQGRSPITIRTTINGINKAIAPTKIRVHGKVVRIIAPDKIAGKMLSKYGDVRLPD